MKKYKLKQTIITLLSLVLLSGCSAKNSSSSIHDDMEVSLENGSDCETHTFVNTTTEDQTEKVTEPLRTHFIDESNIDILNENTYNKKDIVDRTNQLLLFKPLVSICEAFPGATYEEIAFLSDFSPTHYNEGKLFTASKSFNDGKKTCDQIQCYDLENGKISTLFQIDSTVSILLCEGKYLIWQEDSDEYWLSPSYHLYNLETGEDVKFYDAVLDENGKSYYGLHFNEPIIINDKIYFDDMIGIYDDNVSHYIIYCYDIEAKTIETIYDDAQEPVKYKGKLAWHNLSSNRKNAVFCNNSEAFFRFEYSFPANLVASENLLIMHDQLSYSFMDSFDDTLPCVECMEEYVVDPEYTWNSNGIKIIRNNKIEPILIGSISSDSGYITNPESDGRFVFWRGSNGDCGKPTFYDSKKDIVIEIDFLLNYIDPCFYSYIMCDDKLILKCCFEDLEDVHYFIISLNEKSTASEFLF